MRNLKKTQQTNEYNNKEADPQIENKLVVTSCGGCNIGGRERKYKPLGVE